VREAGHLGFASSAASGTPAAEALAERHEWAPPRLLEGEQGAGAAAPV